MDCRILRQNMLKSDGHLVCDDSVGYGINLGHVSLEPGWRIKDVLNSPKYRHVRHSFAEDRIPWPGMCEGCDLFSAGATTNDTLDHRVELLIEPTLSCDISCACCFRKQIISKGRSTGSLDPAILLQLVKGCNAENINIEQVHYIGWGEPLMHDRFEELPNIVKRTFPLASQTVTTAANVEFRRSMGSAPLDSIVVSADSSRQSAYERYRRGGHMQTVFKFMADCKRHGHNGIFPEWKHILFEWNDSNEDVLEAQRIGDDLGVDSLLFIITSSKWASQRYTTDSASLPETIELILGGAMAARKRPHLRRHDALASRPSAEGAMCGFMFRIPVVELPETIKVRVTGSFGSYILGGSCTWRPADIAKKKRADFGDYRSVVAGQAAVAGRRAGQARNRLGQLTRGTVPTVR